MSLDQAGYAAGGIFASVWFDLSRQGCPVDIFIEWMHQQIAEKKVEIEGRGMPTEVSNRWAEKVLDGFNDACAAARQIIERRVLADSEPQGRA